MIEYFIADPTGNITLLVTSPVAEEERTALAKKLLSAEPEAEQLGFLEGNKLHMSGGEFCGNASMSAAALILGGSGETELVVSGCSEAVPVKIERLAEGSFAGRVTMPEPERIFTFEAENERLPAVKFPGITHIICRNGMSPEEAKEAAPRWCRALDCEALGIMLLSGNRMTPVVYVSGIETLFEENSCASGTAAVGVYFAAESGERVSLELLQPGGALKVEAENGSRPALYGRVRLSEKKFI